MHPNGTLRPTDFTGASPESTQAAGRHGRVAQAPWQASQLVALPASADVLAHCHHVLRAGSDTLCAGGPQSKPARRGGPHEGDIPSGGCMQPAEELGARGRSPCRQPHLPPARATQVPRPPAGTRQARRRCRLHNAVLLARGMDTERLVAGRVRSMPWLPPAWCWPTSAGLCRRCRETRTSVAGQERV